MVLKSEFMFISYDVGTYKLHTSKICQRFSQVLTFYRVFLDLYFFIINSFLAIYIAKVSFMIENLNGTLDHIAPS